jgi:hypothetical protein
MTYQELNLEISNLKLQLKASDYKAIKHSEGLISEADYAPIKAERQAIRDRINAAEALLPDAKAEFDRLESERLAQEEIESQAMPE